MRINEIKELTEKDVIASCRKILVQCSEFVSDMRKAQMFLYRGVNYSIDASPIFMANSPEDRKPIGQTQREQYILDMLLSFEGFESLRSNSVACSSTLSEITRFGRPYIIFPINEFSFTWSSVINDIGSNMELAKSLKIWDASFTAKVRSNKEKLNAEEFIKQWNAPEFIKKWEFKNTDMIAALNSGNEISIHGKYFAISRCYIDIVSNFFKVEDGD